MLWSHVDNIEMQRREKKYGNKAKQVDRNHTRRANPESLVDLNEAIGILERSYSTALNKERGTTGHVFRGKCKAKDGWIDEFITLKKPNGKTDFRFLPGNDYGFQCMNYIHENALAIIGINTITDWPWSSARDYAGLRRGTLCNLQMGRDLQRFL